MACKRLVMTRPKCLIVDDLDQNIIVLSSLLKELEIEILPAHSGKEALELLLKHEFALSLLDVQMPGMDGFELAEIMRSTEKTKGIPIIFVTAGDTDTKRIFKGYDAGAVDFLQKPLHDKIVRGKIRVFIELYNQKKLMEESFKTANEELEKKVQERTHALMEANKEIEAFSYSVSHDLRSPLRSMDGFSNALLKMYDDKLDDRGRNYLNRIRESAQKMGELIDGMLVLSRLGRKEIKRETIDISQLSEKILNNLKEEEPQRQLKISIKPSLVTHADLILAKVVLQNLLANAWKYTSKKEEALIEVGSKLEKDKEIFYIRDNGAGFDMQYSDKLFGAFQRLHNVDEFPGMGIGLATVKRILTRHGGDIWFEGVLNEGATFYFTFNQ